MTKIDIISGFLGAGKTTLIKKLIEEVFQGQKIVLIENEFGEVGIDGGFLKDAGIEITEMNSGCICCSLVGDFDRNLKEVLDKFQPDRILIEPSGVGKLSDVMKSVIDLEKERDVKLNGLVTVVNAKKALKQMKAFGEFFNNQIEFATTVVLSRSQSTTPQQLELCVKHIQALNEKAALITTPWEEISGEAILKVIEQGDCMEMELLAEARHAKEAAEHAHHHHHEHEKDSHAHDGEHVDEGGHDHSHAGGHHNEGAHHDTDGSAHSHDGEHHHAVGHGHDESHAQEHQHDHAHGHEHESHAQEHQHDHAHGHEHESHAQEHQYDHAHGHEHESHAQEHQHDHAHGHEEYTHADAHHHDHAQEHQHGHAHGHGHEEYTHADTHQHDHEGHTHHAHEGHAHHHADEIFTSWGKETPHKYERSTIENALKALSETEDYGDILRAKGMVESTDGTWIYFDMVPGEYELREGEPEYTGRLCVIGCDLAQEKLSELFELA